MRRAALVALLVSCRPDFGDRDSLVVAPIVVAVRGEPPEAKPGDDVTYSVLVATPDGPVSDPSSVAWSYCATPKLLTENGAVSAACVRGESLRPIGAVPADACLLFGPETSSADLRPRDPDATGGFYQPVRVVVDGEIAFGEERVRCNPANVAADRAAELDRRYVANRNPELVAVGADTPIDSVPHEARVVFRASWSADSAETYAYYDPTRGDVVDRRETMRVSWFATAGAFANDRTGRTGDDLATFSENAWTAPGAPGLVHVFVVLRDDRGGVAFRTFDLAVR